MKNEDVFTWLTLVQQFVDFLLSQIKIRANSTTFIFNLQKKKVSHIWCISCISNN